MQCVVSDSSGYLVIDNSGNCQLVVLSQTELETVQVANATELLDTYFGFHYETFSMINGSMLLAFVVGHGLGRIVRSMGKS